MPVWLKPQLCDWLAYCTHTQPEVRVLAVHTK